jgi:tetratricopeptide (TPR) repeat protein
MVSVCAPVRDPAALSWSFEISRITGVPFNFSSLCVPSHSFQDSPFLALEHISTMADVLKAEGNKAFAAKNFDEAMYVLPSSCTFTPTDFDDSEKFTQAIEIEPENHVLYSNRSGAYASLKDFDKALEDADKTTTIKPDWAKGWGRKGTALHGKGDLRMKNNTSLASRFNC